MPLDLRHRRRLVHSIVTTALILTAAGVAPGGIGHAVPPTPSATWSRAEIRPGQTARLVVKHDRGTPLAGLCTWIDGELEVCSPVLSDIGATPFTYEDLYAEVGTVTLTVALYAWSRVSIVGEDYILDGKPWSTSTLTITNRPTTPRVAALTRDDGRVWVTARPPRHDGGSPIISYQARCTDGDETWTSFVSTNATNRVGRLPTGVRVNCSVRALNGNGWSAWSRDRRLTTSNRPPLVPEAPTISSADLGVRQIVVTVEPPARRHGSVIEQFEATCRSGRTRRFSEASAAKVHVVGPLTSRHRWLCSARARNHAGWSPWSAPAIVAGDDTT